MSHSLAIDETNLRARKGFLGLTGERGNFSALPVINRLGWVQRIPRAKVEAATAAAGYCSACKSATCSNGTGGGTGCPFGHHIRDIMTHVANGNWEEAARLQLQTTIFEIAYSQLCPTHEHCEGECFNGRHGDNPVAIKPIQRTVAEWGFETGFFADHLPEMKAKPNGKTVAIIGGGFAGLEAAYYLALKGWEVKVYDANPKVGGLGAFGIPPTKMDYEGTMAQPIALMEKSLGIKFYQNHFVTDNPTPEMRGILPKDIISFSALRRTYDQKIITIGTPKPNELDFQKMSNGIAPANVTSGDHFLYKVSGAIHGLLPHEEVSTHLTGKRVVVIGAGDTAMDVASMALRSGAVSVQVVARNEVRADQKERSFVTEEGAEVLTHHAPVRFVMDENNNAKALVVENGTGLKEISLDACFYAIGYQTGLLEAAFPGIKFTNQGLIQIDKNGQTSHSDVLAAGDVTSGPYLASRAGAHGKMVAMKLHARMFPKAAPDVKRVPAQSLDLVL